MLYLKQGSISEQEDRCLSTDWCIEVNKTSGKSSSCRDVWMKSRNTVVQILTPCWIQAGAMSWFQLDGLNSMSGIPIALCHFISAKVFKGVQRCSVWMVKNGETIPPFISLCPISSQDIKAVFLFVSPLEMGRGQTPSIHQYSHVGLGVLHDLVPSIHQLFCAFSACCHCCLRIFALLLEPICYPYMLGKLHLTFRGRGTVKQTF